MTEIAPDGGTQTLIRPELSQGDGDSQHRAHIVRRPDGQQSADAWVTEARVFGYEVEALCGFKWVPARNPEKYPVCEACKDILTNMK